MQQKAKIEIIDDHDVSLIRLIGWVNLERGQCLRDFADALTAKRQRLVHVDMVSCIGIDSTIIGLLIKIQKRCREIDCLMEILNADRKIRDTINSLIAAGYFVFKNKEVMVLPIPERSAEDNAMMTKIQLGETILDANLALMEANRENIARFEKANQLIEQDLAQLKKKERGGRNG